jgi:polyhydroxyalkanoate synthesis regulator phasin
MSVLCAEATQMKTCSPPIERLGIIVENGSERRLAEMRAIRKRVERKMLAKDNLTTEVERLERRLSELEYRGSGNLNQRQKAEVKRLRRSIDKAQKRIDRLIKTAELTQAKGATYGG